MCGDVEMHDPPAVVSQHQEHAARVRKTDSVEASNADNTALDWN
jgi:hypothetical protein